MDKFSQLQPLASSADIVSSELNSDWEWTRSPKATHVYEGTDSEEDASVNQNTRDALIVDDHVDLTNRITSHLHLGDEVPLDCNRPNDTGNLTAFETFQLGQLAPPEVQFCPLAAVKKYPYAYIGSGNRQKVAETFFDKNQLLDKNTWDLFYIYKNSQAHSDTIILVPTIQFTDFLDKINQKLDINLTIPPGAAGAFEVSFDCHGTPCPRYLGRSISREMAENLKKNVPPLTYRLKNESEKITPTDRSLEAFRRKIELLQDAQKNKKKATSETKKAERIIEKQAIGHSLKRVQRYLGLRQTRTPFHSRHDSELAQLEPTRFFANQPPKFPFEGDAVFVCVDIEAYEMDHNKITEIGISTLDTRDLAGINPGEGGRNWMESIRARHFRISDYKHLVNKRFVVGCADRFEFGESEFISLKEASKTIASCFKPPYSKVGDVASTEFPKRNVILVGHDIRQDVNYMRKAGFEVYNMSNLMEEVDTAAMWRYTTRDAQPRNLGSILAELGLVGWNLHNAGNDAAYTLQAMIAISIKAIVDKQRGRETLEQETLARAVKVAAEARTEALDREKEWDSNADSDGGDPVKPGDTAHVGRAPPRPTQHIESQPWELTEDSVQRAYQTPLDKKDRKAQILRQKRDWDNNEDAEKGGWAASEFTQPVGIWNVEEPTANSTTRSRSSRSNSKKPNSQEARTTQNVWAPQCSKPQRWGGLHESFVSAGIQQSFDSNDGDPPTGADLTMHGFVDDKGHGEARRAHPDAW